MSDKNTIATTLDAIKTLSEGRMIILVDDEDRENEGDIVAVASTITADQIAFMARKARGLVCLAMAHQEIDRLALRPMTSNNTAPHCTAFTVSIDAREDVTTGISAKDRATTIRKAIDPTSTPADFVSPGSVFPLRAVPGGVLERTGQTEGSVDLAKMAGLPAGAVICEILKEDGTMMRLDDLLAFGKEHDLPVCTVADIVAWRLANENLVSEQSQADLPTDFGGFTVRAFTTTLDDRTHLALVKGNLSPETTATVRVHRANFPGDVFFFNGSTGRTDIENALKIVSESECGVFLYLNREETGVDLLESLGRVASNCGNAQAVDTAIGMESRMTFRDFGVGAQILSSLGIRRLRIITNHPRKFSGLAGFGLEVENFIDLPSTTMD